MVASQRAYSYIRFSSPQQAAGGSFDRQTDKTLAYYAKHGLTLDDSLTLSDLGVSAFRGDNIREGALGGFLEACRTGRVARGSTLIVESLDRISRDMIRPALRVFMEILDHGVAIVTHNPERRYAPESTDALSIIEPLLIFFRSNEESEMKSARRKDGWTQAKDRARQDRKPFTHSCPAWLSVQGGEFVIREDAAQAVRRIFELAADGLGAGRIVARLNEEGVPPIGRCGRVTKKRQWVKVYVSKMLADQAAIGCYQPMRRDGKRSVPDGEPIPNFYPAIVDEATWNAAHRLVMNRTGGFKSGRACPGAGRKSRDETNIFGGIARSALSGNVLHLQYNIARSALGARVAYAYLGDSRESGRPTGARVPYKPFEAAVLSLLSELRPEDVLPTAMSPDTQRGEIVSLGERLREIDARLEKAQSVVTSTGDFDALIGLVKALHAERKTIVERKATLEAAEASAEPSSVTATQTLIGLLRSASADELGDIRRRLKARITALVEVALAVIVRRGRTAVVGLQLRFRWCDRCRSYIITVAPDSSWSAQSLTDVPGTEELDLRRREDALALAATLSAS